MAQGRNHYEVLGVARDASAADLAAAYRLRLAQLKGQAGVSAAHVAALREAHHVLADPALRADYDKTLLPPPPVPSRPATRPVRAVAERPSSRSGLFLLAGVVVLAGIAAWGWTHRPKPAKALAPAAAAKPVAIPARPAPPAVNPALIVGKWACETPRTGRSAELAYGADGSLRIVSDEGEARMRYRVTGGLVEHSSVAERYTLEVESLTAERMVHVRRSASGALTAQRTECRRAG